MSVPKKYKKLLLRWRSKWAPQLKHIVNTPQFARSYVIFAFSFLMLTTLFWSFLSAVIHLGNADQLVNSYMFDSIPVFKNASFPGQHTFLLKWPLFWLIHTLKNTDGVYIAVTVSLSAVCVGLFAYMLYRINKRPYVLGTLLLALASVLLMVPAQASPGMLLPVNMGMIANRNIEYILLIFSVFLILKTKNIRSQYFFIATCLLILLLSSDRLFLSTLAAGAILAMTVATAAKKWGFVAKSSHILISSIIATIASGVVLYTINAARVTHIVQQTTSTYGITTSMHTIFLNTAYALLGIITNMGANPATHTTVISRMPQEALRTVFSTGGPVTIINICITVFALFVSVRLISRFLKSKTTDHSVAHNTFLLLICVSLASLGAFIFTDHYAAGDARYLTICMFTLFIGLAVYAREKKFKPERVVLTGTAIVLAMLFSVPSVIAAARLSKQTLSGVENRNSTIVSALESHPVNVLLGDYWRVLPIRHISGSKINVMPLSDCVSARDVLSSVSWQANLQKSSFAYILSSDKSATDFPSCTLDDITSAYGKPNASIVIAGTQDDPIEQLLFFDHGAHKSNPSLGTEKTATSPLSLAELPNTTCSKSTRMNIVAHEDDDLLFMNPGLQTDISEGKCVRTIYLTAGDAGANQFYWLSREQGSEAAYNHMIGADAIWIHRTVKLHDKQYITVANPRGNPRVSLIFFRLPDGNLQGNGFGGYGHESIQKLYDGAIPAVQSIYNGSLFTKESLTSSLTELLQLYAPTEIHTQSTVNSPPLFDHSDHAAISRFADDAYSRYIAGPSSVAETATIRHYAGYSVRTLPENVSGEALHRKTETFLRYAQHDPGVCHSHDECDNTPTYGGYLRREYTTD